MSSTKDYAIVTLQLVSTLQFNTNMASYAVKLKSQGFA